ncbi:MAG: hypothetical protein ACREQ5_00115 [Candidatus Dormibacteria bacterium]
MTLGANHSVRLPEAFPRWLDHVATQLNDALVKQPTRFARAEFHRETDRYDSTASRDDPDSLVCGSPV